MTLKPRRVDFNSTWVDLLETVKGVITCGRVERSVWNDRFYVYALCTAIPESHGDHLYSETRSFLEDHVKTLYNEVCTSSEESLLAHYQAHWQEYSRGSSYLNQLYGYLNTQFIKKQKYTEADITYGGFAIDFNEAMLEIGELALDTWRRVMVEALRPNLLSLLLKEVHGDRCGSAVSQSVVHGVINSLVNVEEYKKRDPLKLYSELFEEAFLAETGEYYRQEAARLQQISSCSEYMRKVSQRLQEEDMRSRRFLHPSSYHKVTQECQSRMIADYLQYLHSECKVMVHKEITSGRCTVTTDLTNMYQLLRHVPGGLDCLVQDMEEHIKVVALDAVKGIKGDNIPTLFVESMLEVHKKYTALIHQVFSGDQRFVGALDRACAAAINYKTNPKTICRSPDLLAKYCDSLLKKSAKGQCESEIDDRLASSITVFKYLDDKDIYQRVYARMLAKRLIYSQSQSMDAEEAMINRLKQACGYEFTNKLHRMFTDINISQDLNSKFSDFTKRDEIELGVNFSILVLQAGAWPIGQSNLPSFAIPQELEKSVRMFELFYNKNFNGRKLTWMHSFCNADLKLLYLKKPYFVTMGTFHMGILLPFNGATSLTLRELRENTQLPDKELVKQIQVLMEAKILNTEGDITDTTSFSLNMEYTNKRTKFKITTSVQKDSEQKDVEQTASQVDEDRKLFLQAAIVRIMKARKRLNHNSLVHEVVKQSISRFKPEIPLIKKCIESLIDKSYIERTPNSRDEYLYIA